MPDVHPTSKRHEVAEPHVPIRWPRCRKRADDPRLLAWGGEHDALGVVYEAHVLHGAEATDCGSRGSSFSGYGADILLESARRSWRHHARVSRLAPRPWARCREVGVLFRCPRSPVHDFERAHRESTWRYSEAFRRREVMALPALAVQGRPSEDFGRVATPGSHPGASIATRPGVLYPARRSTGRRPRGDGLELHTTYQLPPPAGTSPRVERGRGPR